jgi:hypothetical protein
MTQRTFSPIVPRSATHRGGVRSVPRMTAWCGVSFVVSSGGVSPPAAASASLQWNDARKKAQQAPHLMHGFHIGRAHYTSRALSRYKQNAFASRICCGVRQSGSKRRGLPTRMQRALARDVATFRRFAL